jgi:ribosome-binding factor A
MQRLNKQIQREISLILNLRIKNETAKQAIITDVDCSRDLEHAKVYYTMMDPSMRPAVGKALASVAGPIRSLLAKNLSIRQVPSLSFLLDVSEEYGRSMDSLLDAIKSESSERRAAGDDGEAGERVEE